MSDTTKKETLDSKRMPKQQGSKGHKSMRINMAISELNYQYAKDLAKYYDLNVTAIVNGIIDLYRRNHPEVLADAIRYHQNRQELIGKEKEADT